MKSLMIFLFSLYCGVCYAKDDIPHVFVDPQGNVVNYANLYRVEGDQVIIRYYFDPSINRLAVEDSQASYALNSIIRDAWREGLLRWVNASGHQFSIEEVSIAARANVIVYGVRNVPGESGQPTALSFPLGMPGVPGFPRERNTGAVYVVGNGVQGHLNTFLTPNTIYSQRFRTYTGVNDARNYLAYILFMDLYHEGGHILGLAHSDDSDLNAPNEYMQRPIANHMPSPIVPGTQVMLTEPLNYLAGRYRELNNHPVDRNDIVASSQERWVIQFLWNQRHRPLHCLPPTSTARNLLNVSVSATSSKGCLTLVSLTLGPSILMLGM